MEQKNLPVVGLEAAINAVNYLTSFFHYVSLPDEVITELTPLVTSMKSEILKHVKID